MALWTVARPAGQEAQAIAQPREHGLRREDVDARRRQLDRQRQAVEARADLRHGRRILVGHLEVGLHAHGPFDEQGNRLVLRKALRSLMQLRIGRGKRRHRVLPLAVDAQSTSAGGEDRETRGRCQQLGYPWRGVAHLLEVVQDQERAALAKMVDQRGHGREPAAIRQAQLLRDGPRHQLRVLQQGERDEEDAVRESVRLASPYLQREARLSGPPWSGQREQAGAAQQLLHFAELALTAEEAGELDRQVVRRGVEGLERGELV